MSTRKQLAKMAAKAAAIATYRSVMGEPIKKSAADRAKLEILARVVNMWLDYEKEGRQDIPDDLSTPTVAEWLRKESTALLSEDEGAAQKFMMWAEMLER